MLAASANWNLIMTMCEKCQQHGNFKRPLSKRIFKAFTNKLTVFASISKRHKVRAAKTQIVTPMQR
jgi:hypothetical protein